MLLFVWRHSKRFSSWSMLDEPQIDKEDYLQADVTVLAPLKAEVLVLLERNVTSHVEELQRIEPVVLSLINLVSSPAMSHFNRKLALGVSTMC